MKFSVFTSKGESTVQALARHKRTADARKLESQGQKFMRKWKMQTDDKD